MLLNSLRFIMLGTLMTIALGTGCITSDVEKKDVGSDLKSQRPLSYSEKPSDEVQSQGDTLLSQNKDDADEAVKRHLLEIYKNKPDSADVLELVFKALTQDDDVVLAELEAIALANPENEACNLEIGYHLAACPKMDAQTYFSRLCELKPENRQYKVVYAWFLGTKGKYQEAQKKFLELQDFGKYPNEILPYLEMLERWAAELEMKIQEEFNAAAKKDASAIREQCLKNLEKWIDHLIALDGDNLDYLGNVAAICGRLQFWDRIGAILERFKESEKYEDSLGVMLLQLTYMAHTDKIAFIKLADDLLKEEEMTDNSILLALSKNLDFCGCYELAFEACSKLKLEDGSPDYDAMLDLAFRHQDYDRALFVLSQVRDKSSENYAWLAEVLYRQKDFDQARKMGAIALDMYAKEGKNLAPVYHLMSLICMDQGDYDEGLKYIENLWKLDEEAPEACNEYAYLLALAGKKLELAEKLIKRALTKEENAAYMDTYAWVLYRQGRFAQADEVISLTLIRFGEHSEGEIFDHAGDIYKANGKEHLAKEMWKKAVKAGIDSAARKITD